MSGEETKISGFLIARGGPFYELQRQLRLLHEDAFRARSRAALFVGLAWGGPLILSVLAGNAWGPFNEDPYLKSLAAWSRFFIAIGLFILMERAVEQRLRLFLAHFERAPLLERGSFVAAAQAVADALKQRDTALADGICLILAFLSSILVGTKLLQQETSNWAVQIMSDGNALTSAGWWCLIVSHPLFVFLLLRWLWRLHVWSTLLRRIAALDLRLVATHPDGRGGLAFIGRYPNAFTVFVFAISCVLGAALAHELLDKGISTTTYGYFMGGWLAAVLGLLTYPLIAFRRPLSELKTQILIASGAQATEYFRARERDILGRNISEAEDEQTRSESVPDPSALYANADKLSTNLISRSTLLPLSAAALLPLVAAGATQLPINEILKILKRLLLV